MDDLAYKLATAKLADDPDQSDPKDAAHSVDGTRRLPYIPLEILQQIAGHLDRPSAFALTLTCKGLRDAGETRLWEELDITSGWNEPVDERGFPVADPSGETWLSLHRTTDARCTAALAGLEAYEYRVECVRRLRLEPSDGVDNATAINMMALLHLVAPNLTHLDLLPLPWGDGDDVPHEPTTWPQSEVTSVEFWGYIADQVPCKYKLSCPRLETLRIAIPTSSDDQLPYVLKRLIPDSNRLSELRIESSSSQWENTWEEPTGKAYRATWKAMHPRLSSVKSLTFGDLEDGTSADLHLLEILSRAPEIGFLRILVAWGDSGDQARCWKAIAGLKKLKKLCLFSADGLDEDFIGRQELGIEELVMDDADLEEQDELSWTAQKLPRAPKLERLMIVTSRRPELHEYADQGVTTPAKPIACERISSRFARNLREYPNLTAVQLHYDEGVFPSMYQPGLDLEYLVPPHRWEKEGHRGMMIRSFDNPSNPSLVLYHIRALTRSLERVGETYVGMKRQWRDLSLYRGRTVPNHILDQVYAAAGQERRWMEGKRGVSLDSKAWSILEEWRMGVDDDSDVESSEEETDGDDGQDSDWEDEDDDMDDDTSSIGSDGAQVEVLEGEEDGAGDDGAWETDSDDPLAM